MTELSRPAQEPTPSSCPATPELTRTVLATLGVLALIVGSAWVLRPFMAAMIWSVTIVIATWPVLVQVQKRLGGRRGAAVCVMTAGLLVVFFAPLSVALGTVVRHSDTLLAGVRGVASWRPLGPPEWLLQVPWVGERLVHLWQVWQAAGTEVWLAKVTPYLGTLAAMVLKELGALGALAMQSLLTILLSAVLYIRGEAAGAGVLRFAQRLAGARGLATARLAGDAIRGVALGVVLTALAQALLGGLGLWVAGLPAVALLTAVMSFLALAQIGVIPVLLPAAVWLLWSDQTGWGIAMLVWMLGVATLDNLLRPWLIQRGADLPWLLVFLGVVGGLMAFGLLGVFLGPVMLAVTWTLLGAWLREDTPR